MTGGASVSAFTHGLFSLVVTPDFMAPLDGVLTSATQAIKGGFWDPWVTAILILVAAGVLIAATRSEVSTAVTTVGWALLVLVGGTYVMSYPVSSARAVDELVQTTVATSARGVGVTHEVYGPPVPGNGAREDANAAQAAIDDMFDTIDRDLFYNGWLEGALGASDSAIARRYGPEFFRASHLTWSEAETVKNDPDAGQAIIEAKKDLWVKTAAAVEREDSGAYQQLTGNNGRWDAAATVALRVALMMPFLAIAAVFIVVAYVATRVFVPLAPAFGVLGLLYVAQDWVITVLKQVGRFIILGPAFFVAALANLLLDTAVLDSDLAFGLKLVIVAAIPFVLFKLLRPGRAIPGARATRRMARSGLGTLVNAFATRSAVRDGVEDARGKAGDVDPKGAPAPQQSPKAEPVATGDTMEVPVRVLRPQELPARVAADSKGSTSERRPQELPVGRGRELPAAQPVGHDLSRRSRRELPAAGSEATSPTTRADGTFVSTSGEGPAPAGPRLAPAGEPLVAHVSPSLLTHPAVEPEDTDVDLSAPVDKSAPRGELMDHASELPTGVVEATTTFDAEGNPVFEIWRPPTSARSQGDDPEEYR
jgi:hypothetical protein